MTTATKLFFVCAVSELLLAVQALWQGGRRTILLLHHHGTAVRDCGRCVEE